MVTLHSNKTLTKSALQKETRMLSHVIVELYCIGHLLTVTPSKTKIDNQIPYF